MCTVKGHPVCSAGLIEKIFYLKQLLKAGQKHYVDIGKELSYCRLFKRKLINIFSQVRYVGSKTTPMKHDSETCNIKTNIMDMFRLIIQHWHS